MSHTLTLVATPAAITRTMISFGSNVEYLPGEGSNVAADRRPISRFEVELAPMRRTEAESLWAFHAMHQGGRVFYWSGGPFATIDTFQFVGQGDNATTVFYLPNRNVRADSISVRLVRASSTSVISATPIHTVDEAGGVLTFTTAPASDWDVEATYACRYKLRFDSDAPELPEIARRVYSAMLTMTEAIP